MTVRNNTNSKDKRRDTVQNPNMIAKRVHYKMLVPATSPKEGNGLTYISMLWFCTKLRHLSNWSKWRFYSAVTL